MMQLRGIETFIRNHDFQFPLIFRQNITKLLTFSRFRIVFCKKRKTRNNNQRGFKENCEGGTVAHCRITIRRMVGKDNEGSVLFALHLFKFEVYRLLFRLGTGNIASL